MPMRMETVTVHVSGTCPGCGMENYAQINEQIPSAHRGSAQVVATVTCGNSDCRAIAQLTGWA